MSKTHSLKLVHSPGKDFDLIYQSLLDFKKFGKIHDYITDVKLIADKSPEYIEYGVFEEIYLLGFIKNNPVYTVKVYEITKNSQIRYVSQVKKNIELVIDLVVFQDVRSGIRIEETFYVKANVLIAQLFLRILKKAHLSFFNNLRTLMLTSIEDVPLQKQDLHQK